MPSREAIVCTNIRRTAVAAERLDNSDNISFEETSSRQTMYKSETKLSIDRWSAPVVGNAARIVSFAIRKCVQSGIY